MQQMIRILGIVDRAKALRLTVEGLCAAAEPPVSKSTVSRWLKSPGNANMATYGDCCDRLEAALIKIEQGELRRLVGLHPSLAALNAAAAKAGSHVAAMTDGASA